MVSTTQIYRFLITLCSIRKDKLYLSVISSVSSRDLLLTGLVKANEVAVRIRAENGKLKSAWSASTEFVPRTTASGTPTTTPVTPTTTPTTGTTPAAGA